MTEAEFFEAQLAEWRQSFEAGNYPEALKALLLCAWNGLPLPDWVAAEAQTAMKFYFTKGGGAEGRGKTGGARAQYLRDKVHRQRHHMAEWELAIRKKGETRADAFRRASERLMGTPARGSVEQIERSYNKVAKEYRG